MPPRRVSLPGADELFRTTGGMALSPSLAPRPAAEASRPETARTVNGTDGAEGAEAAQDDRRMPQDQQSGAAVPPPGQPPVQRTAGGQGSAPGEAQAGKTVTGGRGGAASPAGRAHAGAAEEQTAAGRARPRGRAPRRPSGRERHDEKITVYVSAEELMDLEHTRLVLRGEHGLAVDRGRIVREAIAVVLADLEQRGEASILVRRLRGR
ncbi:Cobyrinic acid a,c-diamide synthase OS=Kitasatospora aureofaciens OX=1894 GN=GCM10010502_70930 PE=4 SV=1 [Kitasatospora aureofaciens]